jgi:hypothetical protein
MAEVVFDSLRGHEQSGSDLSVCLAFPYPQGYLQFLGRELVNDAAAGPQMLGRTPELRFRPGRPWRRAQPAECRQCRVEVGPRIPASASTPQTLAINKFASAAVERHWQAVQQLQGSPKVTVEVVPDQTSAPCCNGFGPAQTRLSRQLREPGRKRGRGSVPARA